MSQRDLEILIMRWIIARKPNAHPERVALSLRTENRSSFVRYVNLELKVLVLIVHHYTALFPHPPPVTPKVQVRLYSVVNSIIKMLIGL